MILSWTDNGWEDYIYWQSQDKAILTKINDLIKQTRREPFMGLGKPEALKGNLKGSWSRRITNEHRLVYFVSGAGSQQTLTITACRFHYS